MSKLIIFKIDEGDINQGFPLLLQMGADGAPPEIEKRGKLPSAPFLIQAFTEWQSNFRLLLESKSNPTKDSNRAIKPNKIITNVSIVKFSQKYRHL